MLQFNNKPYVIYGYAAIPSNKTATFEAGTRVHFHARSVANKASIQVNGATSTTGKLENEVVLKGDRLEPDFSDVLGIFGLLMEYNNVNNLTIKNASIGLLIQNNDNTTVAIKNTQIYNSTYGILAQTAKLI
jgi:hypothetical protein